MEEKLEILERTDKGISYVDFNNRYFLFGFSNCNLFGFSNTTVGLRSPIKWIKLIYLM